MSIFNKEKQEDEDNQKYDYLGRKLSWSGFNFDKEILDQQEAKCQ